MNGSEIFFGGTSFIYPGRGGQPFCFKVAEKDDKERIRTGFRMLSKQSIYNRFFEHLKQLSEQHLDDLVNADQVNHVVWGAFDMSRPDLLGVGLGRYKREPENKSVAELAITVLDQYQGQGVGTILLAILYYLASLSDIQFFSGVILSDNWKLLNRFIKLGAKTTRNGTEHHILVPVYRHVDEMPANSYANLIKDMLLHLKASKLCI